MVSLLFIKLQPFLLIGYQIRDLYANDDTFLADSETWTATALRNGIPYSVCNETYLMGGYDVLGVPGSNWGVQGYYFERIYNDLPPHNIIYYSINLWLVDSWDAVPPDIFQFQFGSAIAEGWNIGHDNFTADYCGSADWPDLPNMTVFGQISHSGSSLTLRIISQLDGYAIDESLGFRDINLIFANSTENNINELCGLSPIPLPTNECSCLLEFYFEAVNPAGCRVCNESCRSCFGPSSRECYECNTGYSFVETECIKCDESCADCYGPDSDRCSSCKEDRSLFNNQICVTNCAITFDSGTVCVSPCAAGEFFSFEDQVCIDICDNSMVIETVAPGVQVCVSHDNAEGFVYWDQTWNSLCPFPLQGALVDNELFCLYSCALDEYLYWDGSCHDACESPLTPGTLKGRQFCQHPCVDSTTDYIYWNGTCESPCEAPLKISNDKGANYCDLPCSEGQFLSQDGTSCLDHCAPPFQAREEPGIISCEYPCSSLEYLHWNGSCVDSCPPPYQTHSLGPGMQYCSYLCVQYGEYFYPREGQCLPTCDATYAPSVQISLDGAWYVACVEEVIGKEPPGGSVDDDEEDPPGPLYYPITAVKIASEKVAGVFMALDIVVSLLRDSHVMILILVIKILNFVKYVDIKVPLQLVQEFHTYQEENFYLNFGPGMSEAVKEKFTKSSLPMVFERAGLHSRFLVNFFKPITSFLIMLGLIIMVAILRRFLQRKIHHQQYILVKMILRRFEIFLKWNLVVLLVICNIDEITLYGILEWKTLRTDSDEDSISLLISLGMNVLSLAIFVAPFYLLDKIYQTRFKVLSNQANEPYFNLLKKIEGFQILWKDFRDSSGLQKSFLSLYILRIALIYMIIGFLYKRPLLQMVLIFSTSLGMLTFMSIVKPFMKKLDFIQSILYEVSMLISIGSMLILAALDRARAKADQLWIFLGDCIMFCNILISLIAIIFFVIKFFLEIQEVWKFYKTVPKPISLRKFAILFLKEDDPIMQELRKNKRTSRRLDLTNLEREIERKNLESYNISWSHDDSQSPKGSIFQRKSQIRRSLFGIRKESLDNENSLSEEKLCSSPLNEKNHIKLLSGEGTVIRDRRKILQEITFRPSDNEQKEQDQAQKDDLERESDDSQGENIVKEDDENNQQPEQRALKKGLETIREMDSMDISENKIGQQMRRAESAKRQELSLLILGNKGLSETLKKIEEEEIKKRGAGLIKKELTAKQEDAVGQEPLFD